MKRLVLCACALQVIACGCTSLGRRPLGFVRGYSWGWTGERGEYQGADPERSLKALRATGTQWICLCFAAHMQTRHSAEILYGDANGRMVSDEEIRRAIRLAQECGFQVILKPAVNCRDGAWRATIQFDTEAAWEQWWNEYRAFLLHYAVLAREEKCRALVVGCEMRSTEGFESRWRSLLDETREKYDGVLIYDANHDDVGAVSWWDAVDVIGVSAYYPVGLPNDSSMETLRRNWEGNRKRLEQLSRKWNRPVLFAECGVRSARTCASMPWDWVHKDLPYDGEEQARYYQAAFEAFWDQPWFIGYLWWDWKAKLWNPDDGPGNTDFGVYGKPAQNVLRAWYAKPRQATKADRK